LDRWKLRDPIKIYRERLLQFGVADKVIADIDAQVRKIVDDATEACKAAPPPPLDIITTDVYADGGWAWRNCLIATRSSAASLRRERAIPTSCFSARTSPKPAACSRRPSVSMNSSHLCACAILRFPSRPFLALPWARR